MVQQVPFYRHDLTPADANKIAKVLATPILTSGAVGKAVEQHLTDFFATRYAGLTSSWTNGALAALLAMDVGLGDEFFLPIRPFIPTANVGEILGAKPVFVVVEPATLLM